jgi:hypothetical protein
MMASKKRWLKHPEEKLWRQQIVRLHTLWGVFCRESNLDAKDRAARLGWTADAIGRQITSFGELTADEANLVIDAIQKLLPPELLKRKRPSRRLAQAYGTAGRRGREDAEIRLVDAETWRLIDLLLARIGWTREQLAAFCHSAKSPVRSGRIATLAEANKVIWSLKAMLRRAA